MTIEQINEYVAQALKSFEWDPADSDFQRCYEAAMQEIAKVLQGEMV